ncbi:MAG: hypothetical protein AAF316_11870 [Cyanobacteria bacterium P01_A01_bin.80]
MFLQLVTQALLILGNLNLSNRANKTKLLINTFSSVYQKSKNVTNPIINEATIQRCYQTKKNNKCQANANWSNNGYKTKAIGFVTLKVILE